MKIVNSALCRRLAVLAVCLGLGFSGPASAVASGRSVAQLHHTAWTARSGAPSQVSALAQTGDGFLWIGTARGLYRFDGIRFELYRGDASSRLPSENIYDLLATRDGGLWIALRPSGLAFLKNGSLKVFVGPDESPRTWVYELAEDKAGRLWAATQAGLALKQGPRWVDVDAAWNFPRTRIRTMLATSNGDFWVATDDAVFRLPAGAKKFVPIGRVATAARMAEGRDGRIWVAEGTEELRWIDTGQSQLKSLPIRLPGLVQDLYIDSSGAIWATTLSAGVVRIPYPDAQAMREATHFETYSQSDGLTSNDGGQILEDVEGNIWIGTLKGLNRFRAGALVPVALPPGHQNLTLLSAADGALWVGSARREKIVRVTSRMQHGLEPTNLFESPFVPAGSVFTDSRAPGDTASWWGGYGAIGKLQGTAMQVLDGPAGLPYDWAWSVTAGATPGTMLVGYGDDGMWEVDAAGTWQRAKLPAGMLNTVPSATYQSPAGGAWYGYRENRAMLLEGGRVRSFSGQDGLDIGRIKVIRGAGNHVWFGGETGLAIYQHGRFHRVVAQGANDELGAVAGIIEARSGDVWLAELGGVVRIPAAEVKELLLHANHPIRIERFDYEDGLPGALQMNWTASTAVEAQDGSLWFATDNGLAWLKPNEIPRNKRPPPVVIRALIADGDRHPLRDNLQLPIGTENLRIAYTALSLTVPERVRFKYKLEGYDAQWQVVGGRREAAYTHLGPGEYRFRVLASNNDGVWNTEGESLRFSVKPAFYQTRLFMIFVFVAGLGLAYLAYFARLHQIKSRVASHLNERHRERERIARDLHDTLLQSVQGLILRFQAVARLIPAGEHPRTQLERALDEADEVLGDGRDRLSALRTSAPPTDMAAELARTAAQLSSDMEFVLTSNEGPELDPCVHEEVFRIAREAVINAFRHSGGSRVECDIAHREGEFVVTVRDDGIGFDPEAPARAGLPGHWGLHGMRERADAIRAKLSLLPRHGGGTEVQLKLSARLAYAPWAKPRPWYRRLWDRDSDV